MDDTTKVSKVDKDSQARGNQKEYTSTSLTGGIRMSL